MTQLYRHYSSDGALLYVGISLSALQRLRQHKSAAQWYEQISTVTIEQYESRKAAEEAEKQAIKKERPLMNVIHNTRRIKCERQPQIAVHTEHIEEELKNETARKCMHGKYQITSQISSNGKGAVNAFRISCAACGKGHRIKKIDILKLKTFGDLEAKWTAAELGKRGFDPLRGVDFDLDVGEEIFVDTHDPYEGITFLEFYKARSGELFFAADADYYLGWL